MHSVVSRVDHLSPELFRTLEALLVDVRGLANVNGQAIRQLMDQQRAIEASERVIRALMAKAPTT